MNDERTDYLAAYKRSVATPPGVREDNLAAIYDRAAAIEDERAAPRTRWAASVLVLKISTAAVLTTGIGVAVATAVSGASSESESVAVAPTVEPARLAPAPAKPMAPASAVATPNAVEPAPVATPTPPVRPRVKPSVPAVAPADQLEQELALIEAARGHLEVGKRDAARRSLREHARRFPAGTLAAERDAWTAIVQCGSESAQPRAAARSFILTHGDTPLAAKVKNACGL